VSPDTLTAAIKAVPKCDALIVHVGGEAYRYPASRIKRAVAAVHKRRGLTLCANAAGLHFRWDTGGLRLRPDTWVYRHRREHGRTVWKLVDPGVPVRPAHVTVSP
jgi:hypothetical protein